MGKVSLVLALLSVAAVHAGFLEYDDCGSTARDFVVFASDCKGIDCTVYHQSTVFVVIEFTAEYDTTTLTTRINGIISGVENPFTDVPTDACEYLQGNSTCPIAAGDSVRYAIPVPVLEDYPVLQLTTKWELVEDSGESAVCFLVTTFIEPPL